MAIYRRQPYDYGAKFGNTAQNVLSAILGVKGLKGSQAASAAGAELDKAQAAKVAQETEAAKAREFGLGRIPERAGIMREIAATGDPNLFYQGTYPLNDTYLGGLVSATLGPTGGMKEFNELVSSTPQQFEAGKMWSENPELAQIRAATEGMQKASTIPSVTIPGQGMRIYSPGGKQTGTRPTDIEGKMLPMPYEEIVPPSLGKPIRLTSEGNVVGKVSEEQALEAIRASQGLTPEAIAAMKAADLSRLSSQSLADSMLSTDVPPGRLPYSIIPSTTYAKPPIQLEDITKIPPELLKQLLMKLYGTGGLFGSPQ